MSTITKPQLQRLQVVYKQFEARSLDTGTSREDRLAWASSAVGRTITSFSMLKSDEAKTLIDGLQQAMGLAETKPARRMSRREGQKAGTEGRHDQIHGRETTMVSGDDIKRIQRELDRLGWNQERLDAFLASTRSPIGGRTQIRTLGDANRVYWALKHMKPQPSTRLA